MSVKQRKLMAQTSFKKQELQEVYFTSMSGFNKMTFSKTCCVKVKHCQNCSLATLLPTVSSVTNINVMEVCYKLWKSEI